MDLSFFRPELRKKNLSLGATEAWNHVFLQNIERVICTDDVHLTSNDCCKFDVIICCFYILNSCLLIAIATSQLIQAVTETLAACSSPHGGD